MAKRKKQGGITHRIAMCTQCEWRNEDVERANQTARTHTKNTGHKTTVETGSVVHYTAQVQA